MKQLLLLVFALSFFAKSIQAQSKEKAFLVGEMIDKTGQQQAITQQLGKWYIAMYLGVETEKSKKDSEEAIALFEQYLLEMKTANINGRFAQYLRKQEDSWGEYKKLINSRPSKENIEKLLTDNNSILEICQSVSRELELYATRFASHSNLYQLNKTVTRLEMMAAKQRMLTERVLFYYLANQAILGDSDKVKEQLDNILKEYENTFTELVGAAENTLEIDYRLGLLSKEWLPISKSCREKIGDISKTKEVLDLGNKLSNAMEEITKLYEQLIDTKVSTLMLNHAIDVAGHQGIIIQKILQAYILVGMDSKNFKYKENINSHIQNFENNIDELKLFAPINEITKALEVVDELWTDYRNEAMATNSLVGAKKLFSFNNELVRACDNVVMMMELYAKLYNKSINRYNNDIAHWIAEIDHQEMLTEQILAYTYGLAWGVDNIEIIAKLERLGMEYLKNLSELNSQVAGAEIEKRGQVLAKQWQEIKQGLESSEIDKAKLVEWATSLTKEVHALTELYQTQINGLLVEEAVDKADAQCMLSQRIALAYLAIGMGLDAEKYQQQLDKDKLLFQRQMEELKVFAKDNATKQNLTEVSQSWNAYQVVFSNKVSKDKAVQLLDKSKELLAASEKVVEAIEVSVSNNKTAKVKKVNKAAHLRTMTEQIALYVFAQRWDLGDYTTEIQGIFQKFKQITKELAQEKNYSSETVGLINNVEQYCTRLEERCQKIHEVDLYSIVVLHNMLLLETEKLTKMYEQGGVL